MANISLWMVDVGSLGRPQLSVDIQPDPPDLDLAAVSCGCTSAPFLLTGHSSCSNIMRFIMCPGGCSIKSSNCVPLTSPLAADHFQSAEASHDAAGAFTLSSITQSVCRFTLSATFTAQNRYLASPACYLCHYLLLASEKMTRKGLRVGDQGLFSPQLAKNSFTKVGLSFSLMSTV